MLGANAPKGQRRIALSARACESVKMLSYQHGYHAGNLADVHKHALLAWVLTYMTAKDKPLSYIETHAGRGLYSLDSAQALKTGEAAAGILRAQDALPADHPYLRVLGTVRAAHGPMAYPGSPLIASHILRPQDHLHLAELHPQEHAALRQLMARGGSLHPRDGLELAQALCPPSPRRGVLMVDPSYEVKSDYAAIPRFLGAIRRKWNVGVLMLWYPILSGDSHRQMVDRLRADHADLSVFETHFPPIRDGHRMIGSGLAVINAPFGMAEEAARIDAIIRQITA